MRGKEAILERRVVAAVVLAGGIALKLSPVNGRGVPDRLIILPGGKLWFVELKADKCARRTPTQMLWARKLANLDAQYLCTHDFDEFKSTVLPTHDGGF